MKSFFELVEMEIRCEVLSEHDFPGDDTPIIQGSAPRPFEDPDGVGDKIMEPMDAADTWIPTPERCDKPFLMPEDASLYHRTWNSNW